MNSEVAGYKLIIKRGRGGMKRRDEKYAYLIYC